MVWVMIALIIAAVVVSLSTDGTNR